MRSVFRTIDVNVRHSLHHIRFETWILNSIRHIHKCTKRQSVIGSIGVNIFLLLSIVRSSSFISDGMRRVHTAHCTYSMGDIDRVCLSVHLECTVLVTLPVCSDFVNLFAESCIYGNRWHVQCGLRGQCKCGCNIVGNGTQRKLLIATKR